MNKMSEGAHRENMLSAINAAKPKLDALLEAAERNGWNAAINACREILPAEHSLAVRKLYKLHDPVGCQLTPSEESASE